MESRVWNTNARLTVGDRVLGFGLDYGRRWNEGESRRGGVTAEEVGVVRESISASAGWRPADLPSLTLRLARTDTHDDARAELDRTSDEASLVAAYQPAKDLDLRYALRYTGADDHLTGVVRNDVQNSAAVTWSGRYLAGRGVAYVGYNIAATSSDVEAPSGTMVEERRLPVAGLSVVEAFPATPLSVRLAPNPALIDGNVEAGAGMNLGTAAGAGPVVAYRDLGAQFADVVTPVNAIYVYVDQDQVIPAPLAALFTWDAFQSDDNERGDWTPVAPSGPAVYNPALFRFEIPIQRTAARFLKVVTRPLPEAATADPQFREIFVTDVQFFDVVPAEAARGSSTNVAGNLSGSTRIVLVPGLGLAYDFTGSLSHAQERDLVWSVVNGIGFARRLPPVYSVAARVERGDSDSGRGLDAVNRWSASFTAEPLPTLSALVSYSGQLAQPVSGGTTLSNSGTFATRADLYEGIAVGGNTSVSWTRTENGVRARSVLASATASVVPNPMITLAGSWGTTDTRQSGGGQADRHDRRGQVEGSASFSPFPALSGTASIVRQYGGTTPAITLWSFSGALSPFPRGDLQLRYSWTESYDTAVEQRTRSHGPSARWNIRPGWFVNATYAIRETSAPALSEDSRSLNANLVITFR